MQETVTKLIALQKIDSRLLEIEEIKGDLPIIVEKTENLVNNLKDEVVNNIDAIKEIEKTIRELGFKVEDSNEKLKKYKDQLYLVKSNKEYDAISLEIDHMKSTISNSEEVQLAFEEEKTQLEDSIELNIKKIADLEELLINNRSELDAAMAENINEQQQLESNKKILHQDIEVSYLNTYEQLRGSRSGIGLVSIIDAACGGCYSQLPPQTVIEIKENNKIISCPNCSVLLFWDGAEEY